MRTRTPHATSIHKVRRDVRGGKRGDGDRRHERIRRADPTRIHRGHDDATLTGVAGLASFGSFCRRKGIDAELRRLAQAFGRNIESKTSATKARTP